MLCIQEELGQLAIQPTSKLGIDLERGPVSELYGYYEREENLAGSGAMKEQSAQDSSSPDETIAHCAPMMGPVRGGWMDGILGCLRPVWTMIGKAGNNEMKANLGKYFLMLIFPSCAQKVFIGKLQSGTSWSIT